VEQISYRIKTTTFLSPVIDLLKDAKVVSIRHEYERVTEDEFRVSEMWIVTYLETVG